MPVRFRPRVGPFVWAPPRRPPSVAGQVLRALFYVALLVALLVAVVMAL